MIETVTFDFWRTLMAETPESNAANEALRAEGVGRLLAEAGHPVDRAALAAAYRASGAWLAEIWGGLRDVSTGEQAALFLACLDPTLPGRLPPAAFEGIVEAYATAVLHHPPVLAEGAREAIEALRARGVTLAVISNSGRTPGRVLRRLLDRSGVLDAFQTLSFSDEVGWRKPHTEIFQRTLGRVGARPETALHVGDDPEADVAGARTAGMRALLYLPDGRPEPSGPGEGILRRFVDLPALLGRLA